MVERAIAGKLLLAGELPCAICGRKVSQAVDRQDVVGMFGTRATVAHASHFFKDGQMTPDYDRNIKILAKAYAEAEGLPTRR